MVEVFLFWDVDLFACEKILDFVFVVHQNAAVDRIHQNPANPTSIPVVAIFGFVAFPVQVHTDGSTTQTLLIVEGEDFSDDSGFLWIDFQSELVVWA